MTTTRKRIFISSVQKEFAQVRRDLKAFLMGDAVLRRFVSDVFLFEELPARDQRADTVYLEEVERCDIYLGIFGYEYGFEDADGVSPTEREYSTMQVVMANLVWFTSGAPMTNSATPRCGSLSVRQAMS